MSASTEHAGNSRVARRPLLGWDLGVAAITVFQSAVVLLEGGHGLTDSFGLASETARVVLVLSPLPLLVVLYLLLGRPALRRGVRDEPLGRDGAVFLSLLLAVLGLAVALAPTHAMLQAVVYPIVWTVTPRYRDAIAWSAATALVVGASMYAGLTALDTSGPLGSSLITMLASFAFAVVMGTWITRVFEQGERFRSVAEQLRDAQSEVSALSEAAGAASERERISRELHDTLTQTLTGLVMLSDQAERSLDAGDPVAARERIGQVRSAARAAVEETRALVATHHPLGDGGLEQAIERIAARMRAETGIAVDCTVESIDCGREQQVVLLRAAQEGLANVRKHSRATAATITLRRGEDPDPRSAPGGTAVLAVSDNGVGPGGDGSGADDADGSGGYGLTGLRDRARHVRGDLWFGPGPHGGARLELRLPLTASAAARPEQRDLA